jgi:DNA-binding YbaB/EbfC family protein
MTRDAGWMEKITQIKDEMIRAQEELAGERITISAGGEAIKVVIDGQQHLHQVTISPQALIASQSDAQMLQDLLMLAINQAIEQSQALAAERLQGLTGGMDLPGS